jgi:hypothetical protein
MQLLGTCLLILNLIIITLSLCGDLASDYEGDLLASNEVVTFLSIVFLLCKKIW